MASWFFLLPQDDETFGADGRVADDEDAAASALAAGAASAAPSTARVSSVALPPAGKTLPGTVAALEANAANDATMTNDK